MLPPLVPGAAPAAFLALLAAAAWHDVHERRVPNGLAAGIALGALLAGPFPAIDSVDPGPAGFSGSLIVAEFPSLEAARAWADVDPYVAAGVYEKVTVKPFKKVLPA